jgi:hypothetical protein
VALEYSSATEYVLHLRVSGNRFGEALFDSCSGQLLFLVAGPVLSLDESWDAFVSAAHAASDHVVARFGFA